GRAGAGVAAVDAFRVRVRRRAVGLATAARAHLRGAEGPVGAGAAHLAVRARLTALAADGVRGPELARLCCIAATRRTHGGVAHATGRGAVLAGGADRARRRAHAGAALAGVGADGVADGAAAAAVVLVGGRVDLAPVAELVAVAVGEAGGAGAVA